MASKDANYKFTQLDVPGSTSTVGLAINDDGVIAGQYYFDLSGHTRGFVYDRGNFTTIATPPDAYQVWPAAINKFDEVAGWYHSDKDYGFMYDKGALLT